MSPSRVVLPGSSPAAAAGTATAEGDEASAAVLQRHRLLEAGYQMKSKAFMLTLNSRTFKPETWPAFRDWVVERRGALGASRWAACLEESLHAAPPAGAADGLAAPRVFHLHAYPVVGDGMSSPAWKAPTMSNKRHDLAMATGRLWWTDGLGLRRRNTDDLVFDGVRPRVDVCTCMATRGRPLRVAAAQGLWYSPPSESKSALTQPRAQMFAMPWVTVPW